MANPLRFHPLVVEDLKAATDWYDGIEIVLGNRFRQSVNERLDSVELFPESYAIVRGTLRVALVNGFPYLMIFEWTSDLTEIVGIFHSASDPAKWQRGKS